ncbi:UTRA domain-containing protein [Yersinia nurmii]|uniref:UTRA domain-containing protein n=2 Tax=Yersinia nurmii TaxID=685706 RepID=A0AAW7K0M8_9GAMM|nr:UTRA domain-containing protein [Yersinia nurmii]MDN0088281.1 UTRA domain-containing protein [Yersinia nurmii]
MRVRFPLTAPVLNTTSNCSNKVLQFMVLKANAHITSQLRVKMGVQVYYVRRLRFIDDEPVQLEDTWMPVALFPDLSLRDRVNSSFPILN